MLHRFCNYVLTIDMNDDGFAGSEMVDWIEQNVEVESREAAVKFAQELLTQGFFRHAFRAPGFSERSYYKWLKDEVCHW